MRCGVLLRYFERQPLKIHFQFQNEAIQDSIGKSERETLLNNVKMRYEPTYKSLFDYRTLFIVSDNSNRTFFNFNNYKSPFQMIRNIVSFFVVVLQFADVLEVETPE